jgi:hypothetical protein
MPTESGKNWDTVPAVNHAIRRATLSVLLAVGATTAAGCSSNEKQSLVLAELKLSTGTQANGLQSVMLTADPGPTKTYPITTLSADQGVVLGLYIPGSVTGQVNVTATAAPSTGCDGYRGTSVVTIDTAGVTKSITILMDARDICGGPGAGGTGGSAGTGGTTGSAGTGGTGGSAGTAGTGGTTGTAGTSGTSGSAGTTGTAGRGGTTGTAGTAGTTGTGGRGGTTGTAGAGGGGTTGTGGMAGYPSISGCRSFNHAATSGCPNVYVNSVAISPDGRLVATGGDDYRVKIWNFDGHTLSATSTVLTEFNGNQVVFSPDGTKLAYTSGLLNSGTISIRTYTVSGWAPSTMYLDDGSKNILVGVGYTPDGNRLVTANAIGNPGGDVFAYNVGTALPAYTAHVTRQPYGLAVSPRAATDGSVGVAVGAYNGIATVFALGSSGFVGTGKDIPTSAAGNTTTTVEFSLDGSQLVTGEDYGAVRFFAYPLATTPTAIGPAIKFAGGDNVNDVAFSPNGLYLAVGGAFGVKQLSIYSVATHAEVDRTTPSGDVNAVAFSPSGSAIIAGLDACGTVIVCD